MRDKLGRFGCVPKNLHPAWYALKFSDRALGMALFVEVEDHAAMAIPTHGEWRNSLCLTLRIDGVERRQVVPALSRLESAGLLTAEAGRVIVHITPVIRDRSTSDRRVIDEGSASDRQVILSQVPVTTQITTRQIRTDQNRSEESVTRVPARERAHTRERTPLGDPPPNTPPSTAQRTPWIHAYEIAARITNCDGLMGHPERHREWASALAAAAEREAGTPEGVKFEQAVERLVRAWMADPFVTKNDPPISNLLVFLQKRARKPLAKPGTSRSWYSDAELLAMADEQERELDYETKHRRWVLKARAELNENSLLREAAE